MAKSGTLYVVATPLGNLNDLSPRAVEVLGAVEIVAAEDTRRSRKLLAHLEVHPRLLSFHAHSPPGRLQELAAALSRGQDVAVLTDAGTPGISDPGPALIRRARDDGADIIPVPGPSAVTTALSVSGLPTDRFQFLGFLPRRGADRQRLIRQVVESPLVTVLFESPHRLVRLLEDLDDACADGRTVVVARELTKVHEQVRSGTLSELAGYYRMEPPRGEITIVLEGNVPAPVAVDTAAVAERGRQLLRQGATRRDAARQLAAECRIPRREAYRIVTAL